MTRQDVTITLPTKEALCEAAAVMTYQADRPGLTAIRRAEYRDAAGVLTDLALVAHNYRDLTVHVRSD